MDNVADITEAVEVVICRDDGAKQNLAGAKKIRARDGCTLNIKIIVVGCGHV